MILNVISDCTYTKSGIHNLVDTLVDDSSPKDLIHIFDLARNSHPIDLLSKVSCFSQEVAGGICKIVVVCDEGTALFLRRYNILCISPSDSVMSWVDVLRRAKNKKWQDKTNIWRLGCYYERKKFTTLDYYILDCRYNGFSFSEISEMSGVSSKTIYSRYSQMKRNFNLNKNNFHLIYRYIAASNFRRLAS